MTTEDKFEQLEKAYSPKDTTLSGMTTEVKEVQKSKALFHIETIVKSGNSVAKLNDVIVLSLITNPYTLSYASMHE